MACKRNAFVMLCNSAPELAVEYLESVINQVPNFDELLQMAVVDLIRKDCKNNAANKVHSDPFSKTLASTKSNRPTSNVSMMILTI